MRTDIHSVKSIIPANYDYCFSYALATSVDGWPCPPINVDLVINLRAQGAKFADHGNLGNCTICGAAFIYGDIWRHNETGEHIHVGHTCADKYQMVADRTDFDSKNAVVRRGVAAEMLKHMKQEAKQEVLNANPGLELALKTNHNIVRDIAMRFEQYATLSPAQIALVMKLYNESIAPKEPTVPAPQGKTTFTGTVVAVKTQEGFYGVETKVTVKVTTPNGVWLAWGTCPAVLLKDNVQRGDTVSISATLKPGRDAHFALMSRPAGKLVARAAPEVAATV